MRCFQYLAPHNPCGYIAPSDNLGFHSGFSVVFIISWPFPSQKCILAVTGLRPFPGPGEGGPPKANSTRCFLWCLLFLGRFPRKNQAWLYWRPIGSSWDDPGAPSHLCQIVVFLDESFTFVIYHHSFGPPPGSSLSMPFGFPVCAAVHSLASRLPPGSKPVLRIRIPLGVSCGVC